MENISDPVFSKTEAQLFIEDDLEFRTITTLLNRLNSHEPLKLDNFGPSGSNRRYLKMLVGFSSLLVRHYEVLAILPKRSDRGTELFMSTDEEKLLVNLRTPSSSPPSSPLSPSSPPSLCHFLTRNPGDDHPVGTDLEILHTPKFNVGADILRFIVENWNQSFEHHVKTFETLLNTCLTAPVPPWLNLIIYILFQSIEKTLRRFNNCDFIQIVPQVNSQDLQLPSSFLGLTETDELMIRTALFTSKAQEIHSVLLSFVSLNRDPELERRLPDDPQSFLVMFDKFFKWLLIVVKEKLLILAGLRKEPNPPEELPKEDILATETYLRVLHYFAWSSDFIAVYVGAIVKAKPAPVSDTDETDTSNQSVNESEGDDDAKEEQNSDIPNDYDSGGGPQAGSSKNMPALVHQFISQVRLITSNFQYLQLLKFDRRLKGERVKFRVLKYPRSDDSLKPWREVIAGLFDKETAEEVIDSLRQEALKKHSRLKPFRDCGPPLRFSGRAHCEAVLGCLYTLANSTDHITWANIPSRLLSTIQNSYNFLAPSKRCCPVCATTIQFLSNVPTGPRSSPLQALSSHSIIFPCAFPQGLPRNIRAKLLEKYKEELKVNLLALAKKKGRASASSGQSEAMSSDGDPAEERRAEELDSALGWVNLLEGESKRLKWENLLKNFSAEEANRCWLSMEDKVKEGLKPPPGSL